MLIYGYLWVMGLQVIFTLPSKLNILQYTHFYCQKMKND